MILCCERCDARYAVDDGRMGKSGRKVRCTSCGHIWFQTFGESPDSSRRGISPEFNAVEAPKPAPKSVEADPDVNPVRRFGATAARKPEPVRKSGVFRKRALRLLGFVLPTAAMVAGLVAFREPLVTLWPPAARLYALAGFESPITMPGLAIRGVRMEEQVAGGHRTVIVDGEVANTGTEPHVLPPLRATLADGSEAKARWSFSVGQAELAPGQAASFHTQLADAPEGARSISVGLWR
jgi:predicted Zn finger-like uncharacterized protein